MQSTSKNILVEFHFLRTTKLTNACWCVCVCVCVCAHSGRAAWFKQHCCREPDLQPGGWSTHGQPVDSLHAEFRELVRRRDLSSTGHVSNLRSRPRNLVWTQEFYHGTHWYPLGLLNMEHIGMVWKLFGNCFFKVHLNIRCIILSDLGSVPPLSFCENYLPWSLNNKIAQKYWSTSVR